MKKQKGLLVRLATLLATLAIAMCAAVPALAAESTGWTEPTGTITISGIDTTVNLGNGTTDAAENPVSEVYKVIEAKYDTDGSFLGYAWVSGVENWVKTNYNDYYENITEFAKYTNDGTSTGLSDNDKLTAGGTVKAGTARDFYNKLAIAVKAGNVNLESAGSIQADGSVTVKAGGYLVITKGNYKVYQAAAVNVEPAREGGTDTGDIINPVKTLKSATVTIKSTLPSLQKTINNKKYVGVQVGDTVTYDLKADIPVFPATAAGRTNIYRKYDIVDNLPTEDGVKVADLIATSASDFTVKADGNALAVKLVQGAPASGSYDFDRTADADYDCVIYVSTSTSQVYDHNNTAVDYRIVFDYDKISQYSQVTVQYKATINENAKVDTKYTNTATLEYSNNPYSNSDWADIPDTGNFYTYALKVIKYDASVGESKTLKGAEFSLTGGNSSSTLEFVKLSDGNYRVANVKEVGTDATTKTLVTNDAGEINVTGLGLGTYTLKETKAPEGYALDSSEKTIEFVDESGNQDRITGKQGPDGNLELKTGVTTYSVSGGTATTKLGNKQGFNLPTTGGMGIAIFAAVGLVLAGCGVALYRHSRKVSER